MPTSICGASLILEAFRHSGQQPRRLGHPGAESSSARRVGVGPNEACFVGAQAVFFSVFSAAAGFSVEDVDSEEPEPSVDDTDSAACLRVSVT